MIGDEMITTRTVAGGAKAQREHGRQFLLLMKCKELEEKTTNTEHLVDPTAAARRYP
jgi:hypothetical protein